MAAVGQLSMGYQIRKVGPEEVDELHEILTRCGKDMSLRFGLRHWDPPYPLHLLRKDAAERSVYAVRADNQTVATFTLGTEPPAYFDFTGWPAADAKAVYLSHLAVLPSLQGRGIGSWCMKAVEGMARERKCEAVRLDAYERHERLLEFYARLGYSPRGTWTFRDTPHVCFEKSIAKSQ